MIKYHSYTCYIYILFLLGIVNIQQTYAQKINGKVIESVTNKPIVSAAIIVPATGKYSQTDSLGFFSIEVPDENARITVQLPGYHARELFLNGRNNLKINMISDNVKSNDDIIQTPLGNYAVKDHNTVVNRVSARKMEFNGFTSVDQAIQGDFAGVQVISQSGMPGEKSWVNIRGLSSIYASNEPLIMIDGMIHFTHYANKMLIDGYTFNPMDIVDIDDITEISVFSDGLSYLGSAGSNGLIAIKTERESETSTSIQLNAYTGIAFNSKRLDVMDVSQYRQYFREINSENGYTNEEINTNWPWLNGGIASEGYYKYNNNTDWQNEIFEPAILQKYHVFLKGGDDVATYNVSTGLLKHKGTLSESSYFRYNLRINGKINITKKFSVAPNVKLSLSDSYLTKQGSDIKTNPILASLLKSPLMAPNKRDPETGKVLPEVDDVGFANISNPVAIVTNGTGNNRNYHFVSFAKVKYVFTKNLSIESVTGLDFNNAREDIFIPDIGVASVNFIKNSPGAMVVEHRSTQNHTTIDYNKTLAEKYMFRFKAGTRIFANSFHYDKNIDFNTTTDDFRTVGGGSSEYRYEKILEGENTAMNWISYYGIIDLDISDKYYFATNLSYDGSSVTNKINRYHLYPSVSLAWRLSSEEFLRNSSVIDDLKLRASWSNTGNMYSGIFDYSKLLYSTRRLNKPGVIVRESIPNEDLDMERKMLINAGIDITLQNRSTNIKVNYYLSTINNLIMPQQLQSYYGYTEFYDNGAVMKGNGLELYIDKSFLVNNKVCMIGGTFNMADQKISKLNYINEPDKPFTISRDGGVEYILKEDLPINTFYGYETNGLYSANSSVIGPNGLLMQAGDIKYTDPDGNNIINDADKKVIGDPNPDFFGSIFGNYQFKQFVFSANFNYSIGNDVFNYTKMVSQSMNTYANQSTDVMDRWPSGSEIPRSSLYDPTGNTVFSDRWIEDGSYLKLKDIAVNYDIQRKSKLYKKMTLYLIATEIFTLTKYSGYDPEFMYMNDPFYMGIDYGKMPHARSIIIGVKCEL